MAVLTGLWSPQLHLSASSSVYSRNVRTSAAYLILLAAVEKGYNGRQPNTY